MCVLGGRELSEAKPVAVLESYPIERLKKFWFLGYVGERQKRKCCTGATLVLYSVPHGEIELGADEYEASGRGAICVGGTRGKDGLFADGSG